MGMADLSTKGRYAARIMVCLASRGTGVPAKKREIAEQEGISPDYAEQLLLKLRAHGLVRSVRGAHGGFVLDRPAHAITVKDVIEATEGAILLAPCLLAGCSRSSECVTQGVWRKAQAALDGVLASVTIGELAEEACARRSPGVPSYAI